jgi:hypothetical protein
MNNQSNQSIQTTEAKDGFLSGDEPTVYLGL